MFTLTLSKVPQLPVIETADLYCAAAWGISPAEWLALTDLQRMARRDRLVFAPNLRTA